MKKCVNGEYIDMTAEEIAAMEAEAAKFEAYERTRPLTAEEVTVLLIRQQVNSLTVDDNTALRMKDFYPAFESVIGQTVRQGFKFTHGGKLWRTEQPEMTIQEHYAPGMGTESLYSEVCETHAGTLEDPIPYSGNMALESGKYYSQDGKVYRCTRDTGNPVYNALSELVGLYVEEVQL
ncbi:MAG: hypothetical protein MR530_00685 [Clostridiales bacterium]|nr:hypothetical protein [Clostridiales bacterium]